MNRSKKDFRKKFLDLRKSQAEEILEKNSLKISKSVLLYKKIETTKNVGLYTPIIKEVNTTFLINEFKRRNIKIFLPKNLSFGQNYTFGNYFGGEELIDISNLDFIIVPGVGFDLKGTRLGYGKGIYDRLLKNYQGLKIGLAFDFQITNSLPRESWDIPMDMIITEKRIIEIKD